MASREQVTELARLLVARHDETACTACLDALDAYVTAQLDGRPYRRLFPAVVAHLDSCVDCAESYALLYDAMLTVDAAVAPAPLRMPDLGFLAQPIPQAGGLARLRDALAASVERRGAHLRLTLTQALLDLMPRPQGPALSFRGADEEGRPLFDVEIDEPEAEVTMLHLTAYPVSDPADRCTLRIQLGLQGRDWPDLADIPVRITHADQHRAGVTDHWGEVVFADVPQTALVELVVEIDDPAAQT